MTQHRRLLASIHDVTPHHSERLDRLVPIVERACGPGKFAMLVVPDFHHTGRLNQSPGFAKRLREWSDQGCEMFLHGFTHLDETPHASLAARLKAERMTAGEGEFLGLSHGKAIEKLIGGRKMIEDAIGRPVAGFIAPAWLYGADSLRAITAQDFELVEDHFRVWNPQTEGVLARGPVVTYASRSTPRLLSSILWSRIATVVLARSRTVRLAVHPHDVDAPQLVTEITRALAAFTKTHTPSHYGDLIER
jgi:uncharacterized protein